MAWSFNIFRGWWNRQPVDVSNEAAPVPSPQDGEPRTASQTKWGPADVAGVCLPTPPSPPGDYAVWRAMDADPALVLSRAVVTAPIREAEVSFEAREGTPDEWVTVVQDAVKAWWSAFVAEALDSLSMGWKPFELVFGQRDGLTVPVDVKPLAQELTTWLHRNGVFAGLRNSAGPEKVELAPENAVVITCGGHNRDPYGIPWHENARETWWRKLQCLADLARLRRKGSGIQGKIWYPPAEDEAVAHTNENAARKVLNAYMAGQGATLPNATAGLTPDTAADYRNIQGLAEAGLWKLEVEDFGSIGPDVSAILEEIAACNADLSRAWHVPERAAQEGQHGTKAEAETHGEISLAMSQLVFNEICDAVTKQVVDVMLVQNWGEEARGAVTIKAAKLRDVFSEGDWKVIDTVLQNPDLSLAIAQQIDLDAVFTRRGIPKLEDVISLADTIAKVQADRQAQQQATLEAKKNPPVPVNGERQQLSRFANGVAYIGGLLGDGHDE